MSQNLLILMSFHRFRPRYHEDLLVSGLILTLTTTNIQHHQYLRLSIQPISLSVYIAQSLSLRPFHPGVYLQSPYNSFVSFLEPQVLNSLGILHFLYLLPVYVDCFPGWNGKNALFHFVTLLWHLLAIMELSFL